MMSTMRGAVAMVSLVGSLAVASGCGSAGVFACASDEQCKAGAVDGACQANGFCSFPDEACPTGQRFGDAAPSGVANTCVEPYDGSGSSSSEGGSTPPDPDGGPKLDSSTSDSTTGVSTTMALDEGTSTGPGATTNAVGEESTTTGVVVEPCAPIMDEFDADAIDPAWRVMAPIGTSIAQVDGQLEITVESSPEWLLAAIVRDLGPMSGGWARVLVDDPVDLELPMAGGISLTNGPCELQLYIDALSIHAFRWNSATQTGDQLAVVDLGELPVWLQLRQDEAGEVFFERSHDLVSWDVLTSGTFPECGDLTTSLTALVMGGAQFPNDGMVGVRRFQSFEACVPQ